MAARTGGAGLPSASTPAAWCFGIFQKTGKDMDHGILFDHARTARIGLPEAVFCEGKPFEALVELLSRFGRGSGHPVLFTRLAPDVFARVPAEIRAGYDYHPLSRTAFGDALPPKGKGRVAVISAGTADGFVAWEAARTLAYLGIGHKLFDDCGVAGLWRLAERLEENRIIVNYQATPDEEGFTASGALRMGVSEMTRFGFGKEEFEKLAELMAECILRNQDVSGDVEALRAGYTEMRYCFQDAEFNAALEHLADCM